MYRKNRPVTKQNTTKTNRQPDKPHQQQRQHRPTEWTTRLCSGKHLPAFRL